MARTNRTPAERYRACSRPARERIRAMALRIAWGGEDFSAEYPELPNALGLRSNRAECRLAWKLAIVAGSRAHRLGISGPAAVARMLGEVTATDTSEALH